MFEHETTDFGGALCHTLSHRALGHSISVVPQYGASLLSLSLFGSSVLDGYRTPEELRDGHWGKSAILFPFPNRLRDGRYSWLGEDYVFPINNASTQNAIHGFVRHEAFSMERVSLSEDAAKLDCSFQANGENAAYPFPFRLDVTFSLLAKGELEVRFGLKNLHRTAIPVGLGFHPYFRLTSRAEDHSLCLPACERVEIDERMIPTGKLLAFDDFKEPTLLGATSLDTCFKARGSDAPYRISLHAPGQTLFVQASPRSFPYFQVFTPPMRESIALEPMTCNVDAFHNGDGLVTVFPGQEWHVAFQIGLKVEG